MARGTGQAWSQQPWACHLAIAALCLNFPVHRWSGTGTYARCGRTRISPWMHTQSRLQGPRHGHTLPRTHWYPGGLHVRQAVLRAAGLVGVQQDGPPVHEHSVSLIHRRQHGQWIFAAVACPPAEDPAKVVPWGRGKMQADPPAQASAELGQAGISPKASAPNSPADPTCAQGQDGHSGLRAGQTGPHLLQRSQHPAHRAVPATHQNPEAGHLGEHVEPGGRERGAAPPRPCRCAASRGVRARPSLRMGCGSSPTQDSPRVPAGLSVGGRSPSRALLGTPADSPGKRAPIGQLEDLVRVQQLPETAEQVTAFEASTLGVHKHKEGPAVWGQPGVLTDGAKLEQAWAPLPCLAVTAQGSHARGPEAHGCPQLTTEHYGQRRHPEATDQPGAEHTA